MVIPPNKTVDISLITINSTVKKIKGAVAGHLTIHTNVTQYLVPVHVYDGRIGVSNEVTTICLGFLLSHFRHIILTMHVLRYIDYKLIVTINLSLLQA